MRLTDKIALVTGSSRGIGKAIALRFAQEGADVVLHYREQEDAAQEVAEAVRAAGRRAHILRADVARVTEVQQLVQEAIAHFGRLDILVNNAGLEIHAPFWEVTEKDYNRVMDVNPKGVFFATQAVVRHLRATGRAGKIINISSVHEVLPFPNFAAYCCAKGGLLMFTRNLAVELKGTGITINGIAPGAIETDINRKLLSDPSKRDALLDQIPLERLGKPEDVAGVAAFLASADADYVTGSTYFVDGGLTWFYEEH
ncbi:MAG TPA: glucose 1-dehydrogenase [Polyangia bacterium]